MGGGLMQLVAYGAQDIYLTGNPQITFFKIVYRRHTNFAIESIEQTLNGSVGFGRNVSCTISRNGDLVGQSFIEIKMKKLSTDVATTALPYYPAEAVIDDISLEIGGQPIDKHYSDYYRMFDELFRSGDEKAAYRDMTNFDNKLPKEHVKTFYLPLLFFFCQSPGLALPLIALQYHEVKVKISFGSCPIGVDPTGDIQASLFCDYVYLDSDERRRFAQVSHEYLISQLQYTGSELATVKAAQQSQNIRLNFNHPTKALFWNIKNGLHGGYTGGEQGSLRESDAPLLSAKLQLNGHDRMAERSGSYFNRVQSYQSQKTRPAAGVYMYSFALRPEEHQPSGTVNLSRIDAATLLLTYKAASAATFSAVLDESHCLDTAVNNTSLNVYALNYNVLRIMSGMGGLAYAN